MQEQGRGNRRRHAMGGVCYATIGRVHASGTPRSAGSRRRGAAGVQRSVPAMAQAVNNPGLLVHAADEEPSTLDPAQVEPGEAGETVILQVYERLLEFAPDSPTLVPALATEVPSRENGLISEDGLTYTFPIRQGVKFHDGTDLTAA